MSQFVFYLPDGQWLPPEFRPCLLASDMMETPIPSQVKWDQDRMSVTVLQHEACRLQALVATPGGAAVLLPTVWLFPQWRPYRLEVELVRGLISRLRRGVEVWQGNGLAVPDSLSPELNRLTHEFLKCWRRQNDPDCASQLWPILQKGMELLAVLPKSLADTQGCELFQPESDENLAKAAPTAAHVEQNGKFGSGIRLEFEDLGWSEWEPAAIETKPARRFFRFPLLTRKTKPEKPATVEDASNDTAEARSRLTRVIGSSRLKWVETGIAWKHAARLGSRESKEHQEVTTALQDIRDQGRRIIWGPALTLQDACLPEGVKIGSDGQQVSQAFAAHLTQQLPWLLPHVDMLHVVSGINGVGVAGLTPTIQYTLVRTALETMANLAPNMAAMISFAQPMGERLAWSVGGQHPDQFLSKLAKERIPIQVIGLELDLGYFPTGTLPRDPLQWVVELQRWAVWGVPVLVFLRVPSRPSVDPKRMTFAPGPHATPSEENQQTFILEFSRLLSALPWIHGVIYNQWSDNSDRFGDSGLNSADGNAKSFLRSWAR
ncbi:MAG: hypothetical protein Q8M16_11750 [Pirellulaceae bacterium]|nr:hypothetical protein [Pirellulaceae bacterium]